MFCIWVRKQEFQSRGPWQELVVWVVELCSKTSARVADGIYSDKGAGVTLRSTTADPRKVPFY